MRRRALVGGAAIVLLAAYGGPAQAETVTPQALAGAGKYSAIDLSGYGKITFTPAALQQSRPVEALVQLHGDPLGVQRAAAARTGRAFAMGAQASALAAQQSRSAAQVAGEGAQVIGRTSYVLNALRVRATPAQLRRVAALPQVAKVEVSRVLTRDNSAGDTFTGVPSAWQDLGATGKGVTVGIIDTGIDYTHADFGGPGTVAAFKNNDDTVIEKGTFPTAKVTGGYDFVGDAYDASSTVVANTIPHPDPDPLDCNGHGTHVAGTAAGFGVTAKGSTYSGRYRANTLSKTAFTVGPGVAPQATLRAYKVFGCNGSVDSDVIVAAIDRAAAEGVDVANMSLGGPFGVADGLEQQAIANAAVSGMLVVVAAGNDGHSPYILGGPASADAALAVAAVDASLPAFPGAQVSTGSGAAVKLPVNNGVTISDPISGELVDVGLGCDPSDYTGAKGKIVLSTRGVCARTDRAVYGQQAGAKAVIMINNSPGLPPYEGPIPSVTIPFLGAAPADAPALSAAVGSTVTISSGTPVPNPNYTRAADFTSSGPRSGDSAAKPDVAAPGVSVFSAAVGSGNQGLYESGTSMATPHTAGVAALVAQKQPTWGPAAIKAAIMSTADPTKLGEFDPRLLGSGLVQPRSAAATTGYLSTPDMLDNVSFGFRELDQDYVAAEHVQVTNTGKKAVTYTMSADLVGASYGARFSFTPARVTVPAGSSRTVSVSVRMSRAAIAALPPASASEGATLTSVRGAVVATPTARAKGLYPLRVPMNVVPKGVSDIKASLGTLTSKGGTQSGALNLRNVSTHWGDADVYAWTIHDVTNDVPDPLVPDIQDAGVQVFPGQAAGAPASDRLMVLAVNSARGASTMAANEFDVLIDTTGDGAPDYAVIGVDGGLLLAGAADGSVISAVLDLKTGSVVAAYNAVAPHNGSTVLLPVLASDLGLSEAKGSFTMSVNSFSLISSAYSDSTRSARFDAYHPAVSTGGYSAVRVGRSASIPVTVDTAALDTQDVRGWLVVSLDDRAGSAAADTVLARR